jgi:formylmethanofuran dehydrogenase subunit E
MFPAMADASQAQLEAYKVMENDDLFILQAVRVKLKPEDLPGRPRSRVTCAQCGEGVNDGRERRRGDRVLCRSCAGESYYKVVAGAGEDSGFRIQDSGYKEGPKRVS